MDDFKEDIKSMSYVCRKCLKHIYPRAWFFATGEEVEQDLKKHICNG